MATFTTCGSIPPAPTISSPAMTAACGTRTTPATSGGRPTISRCRSSITSAWTWTAPTTCTEACRTTAPGSASRSIRAASRAAGENMYGGDGFWMFVDPTDPDYVYAEYQGGEIARVNRKTHETRNIKPLPQYKEGKLRFNWNTPIHVSPTRRGTIYLGAQVLFRSRDYGQTWERVSPDLTTNDPEKQNQEQSGGVTVDNSSAEMHTTIFAISESPKNPDVVW